MKSNIYKVWNLSCRGDKIVFFHLFRYDFGTRLFLSGFHDSSVDFVSAYWLGVIPTFDLNTLAKYFGSVNPTLYAISLMRKECVAMSCIARLRRISRIRDAGVQTGIVNIVVSETSRHHWQGVQRHTRCRQYDFQWH